MSAEYFDRANEEEAEIRRLAKELYLRVDWQWALNGGTTLVHGWKPKSGFIPHRWERSYSEAHILYVLALGSPTFPISPEGYEKWTSSFEVKTFYDTPYIHAGPLFIHQTSQMWLDLHGLRDDLNRKLGFDYFENSRRATYIQRQYAIDNPMGFERYGENCWGITASCGPGPATMKIDGVTRKFYSYVARGVPGDIDDGTVAPWSVVCSLPFAPDITLPTIRHLIEVFQENGHKKNSGFESSYNPTYTKKFGKAKAWTSKWRLGLNQGSMIMMIENYRTGLLWKLTHKSPYIIRGLERAGFRQHQTNSRTLSAATVRAIF